MTTKSGLLLRGSCALLALAAIITPFTDVSAVNYNGGADFDNIAPAGTAYPAGWFGIQYTAGSPSLVPSLTGTVPSGTGTTTGGIYNVTGLTDLGDGGGTTGLGTLTATDGTTTFALVKEYFNNVAGSSYTNITSSYVAELFRLGSVTTPGNTDMLSLQYRISNTQLTLASDLGASPGAVGSGWSTVYSTSSFSGDNSVATVHVEPDGTGLTTPWTTGTYLYLRWYDATGDGSAGTDIIGMALNRVTLTATPAPEGVPEPSTWIAAGLLLGCVAFRSLRRKSDDVMAAA